MELCNSTSECFSSEAFGVRLIFEDKTTPRVPDTAAIAAPIRPRNGPLLRSVDGVSNEITCDEGDAPEEYRGNDEDGAAKRAGLALKGGDFPRHELRKQIGRGSHRYLPLETIAASAAAADCVLVGVACGAVGAADGGTGASSAAGAVGTAFGV